MRRFNRCLIRRGQHDLSIKDAIRFENKRLENKNVEKYLVECMQRMFGDISPHILSVRRRRSRKTIDGPITPIIWHN